MDAVQLAWLFGALVLVLWGVGAYNRLMSLRSAIGRAWSLFEDLLRQREQVASPLVQRLRSHLDHAGHAALDALVAAQAQLQADLTALRGRPLHQRAALAALVAHDVACADALAGVEAAVVAEASLTADPDLAIAFAELDQLETRLAGARQGFNDAASVYDAAIAQFPTRLLVRGFGFGRAGRL